MIRELARLDELPLTLCVKDLMVALSISHNTAYELVRSGKIHSIRVGRGYRIPRESLADFLQGNE